MGRPERSPLVVSASELNDSFESGDLRIIDCRFDLANPAAGREAYLEGHVPGSVYAAVRRLPLPQRLVVELHLCGYNAAECGEMLGIEPATVRKREQRAVERLRERLRG